MDNPHIQSFNPWIGCQKVSPGCDHCYAEALMDKRLGRVVWGPHGERVRTSPANWAKPLQWAKVSAKAGVRHRVFCASLADWLDNKADPKWREDLAVIIDQTPELDWLLLTKRIENFEKLSPWHGDDIPGNIWLGVTAEDQDSFDRRYPILASIPASVHFISYEPAVGPLSLREAYPVPDWIICGGESGAGARYMEPAWAYALEEECAVAKVPFFMKQMTGKTAIPDDLLDNSPISAPNASPTPPPRTDRSHSRAVAGSPHAPSRFGSLRFD